MTQERRLSIHLAAALRVPLGRAVAYRLHARLPIARQLCRPVRGAFIKRPPLGKNAERGQMALEGHDDVPSYSDTIHTT